MTNAFILCDLALRVQKSHAANREGIFNIEYICQWYLLYIGKKGYADIYQWML